jgi:hypothetical protein
MFVASVDNFIFLLLIAVAALFQLLSKAISKSGKRDSNETPKAPSPQTSRPIQRSPRETDADRIRKFLEALGQPPSSAPPPPVLPRSDIPPRPLAPVQPPPVITPRAWRSPREKREKSDVRQAGSTPIEKPARFQQVIPPPVPAMTPATPAFEVHEGLPADLQQPAVVTMPGESSATPKASAASKTGDFRTDIGSLLGSKSSLKEVILLREILGPPRGLQALDVTP